MKKNEIFEQTLQDAQALYEQRKQKAIEYAKKLPKERQQSYIDYVNKELKTLQELIDALQNYDKLPKLIHEQEHQEQQVKQQKPKPVSLRHTAFFKGKEEARALSIARARNKYNF